MGPLPFSKGATGLERDQYLAAERTYCELRTNSVQCHLSVDSGVAANGHLSAPESLAIWSVIMSPAALRVVESSSMDKSKALEAALTQIERAFGKGSIMKLGKNDKSMDIETVSTGSLGLDIALGVGGLPRGRVVEIYGPESSGKTTLALHCLAEAQKTGAIRARLDLALQHHGDLHQSDPHEDRRDVRLAGNHHGRACAEILCLRSPRHPPHRRDQGA